MAKNAINDFYLDVGVRADTKPVDEMRESFKKFEQELAEATKQTEKLDKQTNKTTTSAGMSYNRLFGFTKKLAFKTTALGGSFIYAGKQISDSVLEVDDVISQTGIASESYQDLRQQATLYGVSVKEIDGFTRNWAGNIARLKKEGGVAGKWFTSVFADGKTDMNDIAAVTDRLREAFLKMQDTDKQQLISKELGIGVGLQRILLSDAKTYLKTKKEASKIRNITEEELQGAREFTADIGKAYLTLKQYIRGAAAGYKALKDDMSSSKQKKAQKKIQKAKAFEDKKISGANKYREILGKAPITGDVSGFDYSDLISPNFDKMYPNMVGSTNNTNNANKTSNTNNVVVNVNGVGDANAVSKIVVDEIKKTLVITDNTLTEEDL